MQRHLVSDFHDDPMCTANLTQVKFISRRLWEVEGAPQRTEQLRIYKHDAYAGRPVKLSKAHPKKEVVTALPFFEVGTRLRC